MSTSSKTVGVQAASSSKNTATEKSVERTTTRVDELEAKARAEAAASGNGGQTDDDLCADAKKAIAEINRLFRTEVECQLKIGEIVAGVMAAKKGTGYGQEILVRLAAHSSVECSAEHLRRCWRTYVFKKEYETALPENFPFRHWFALSRLMDIADQEERATAIQELADRAVYGHLTACQLNRLVSKRLRPAKANDCGAEDGAADGESEAEEPEIRKPLGSVKTYISSAQSIDWASAQIARKKNRQDLRACAKMLNTHGAAYLRMATILVGAKLEIQDVNDGIRQVAKELSDLVKQGKV